LDNRFNTETNTKIVDQVMEELNEHGAKEAIPVILGGIIPQMDRAELKTKGIKKIFTPKDFDMMEVMNQIMNVIQQQKVEVLNS